MKVLIIDNNRDEISWGAKDLRRLASQDPNNTVYVRRAPEGDLPSHPQDFDRIILSGSRTSCLEDADWIKRLLDFVSETVRLQKPYLGVCFGHQMLVRAVGGKETVRRSKCPEFGWTQIQISDFSTIFKGMESEFYSYSSHFEEVSQLPEGMKKLAHSSDCDIQACQMKDLPIFGIQFHPEKHPDEAFKILSARRKAGETKYLFNWNRGHELYHPNVGQSIFNNFFNM